MPSILIDNSNVFGSSDKKNKKLVKFTKFDFTKTIYKVEKSSFITPKSR